MQCCVAELWLCVVVVVVVVVVVIVLVYSCFRLSGVGSTYLSQSKSVKHCLDFSFVFSAPLPAWRNLFSASGSFCGGRYQPGFTGIFCAVEGTSQSVTICKKWKNPSSALRRKGPQYRPFSYTNFPSSSLHCCPSREVGRWHDLEGEEEHGWARKKERPTAIITLLVSLSCLSSLQLQTTMMLFYDQSRQAESHWVEVTAGDILLGFTIPPAWLRDSKGKEAGSEEGCRSSMRKESVIFFWPENSLRFQTGVPSTFFKTCPSMSVELAKDLNAAKGFAALRAAKLINKNMGRAGFFSTDNMKKLLAGCSSWAEAVVAVAGTNWWDTAFLRPWLARQAS
jgi:hypothetical protein